MRRGGGERRGREVRSALRTEADGGPGEERQSRGPEETLGLSENRRESECGCSRRCWAVRRDRREERERADRGVDGGGDEEEKARWRRSDESERRDDKTEEDETVGGSGGRRVRKTEDGAMGRMVVELGPKFIGAVEKSVLWWG